MDFRQYGTEKLKNVSFIIKLNILLSFIILSGQFSLAESRIIKIPESRETESFQDLNERDNCILTNYSGYDESSMLDLNDGDKIVEYFDPADCEHDPTYPFSLTSIEFQLFDDDAYVDFTWPCPIDIIVLDVKDPENPCPEPGDELYRFSYLCDSLIFCRPRSGVITFPMFWCVDSIFFIGIEYTGTEDAYPSIMFDDTPDPINCHLYGYDNSEPDPNWTEWYEFSGPTVAGYPAWRVNGETKSPFCGSGSMVWNEPDGIYMPDFDQDTVSWLDYAGPTATANCLWWYDRRFPEWNLVPDGSTVTDFIESLATLMSTNVEPPIGTDIDSLKSGVEQFLGQRGLLQFLDITIIDQPSFDYCREQLLDTACVILYLGGWHADSVKYETPTIDCMEIYWSRVSEHYVTLAGVNPVADYIGIADPKENRAALLGWSEPPCRVVGDNHKLWEGDHNNDGLTISFDVYNVSTQAINLGGLWKLPEYFSYSAKSAEGEDGKDVFEPIPFRNGSAVTVWCDDEPGWFQYGMTVAEIEAAVIISPIRKPVIGRISHSVDGYIPDEINGDPTGTFWNELWPNYENEWQLTAWSDNGDGYLSFCDTVDIIYTSSGWVTREHIEWVGPTLKLSDLDDPGIIVYLEEIDPNPMVKIIGDPEGSRWHEVYPDYGKIWEISYHLDNGDGILGYLDVIQISKVDGQEFLVYNVDAVETDIVTTPLIVPGDEYDHNTDDYIPNPPNGDPTNTTWHELWPNYCTDWNLTEWRDNADGILSRGDSVKFTGQFLPDSIIWKLVEKVTPTITVSDGQDTYYMDYMGNAPDISPITEPVGTYWHETYPQYSHRWLCLDWVDYVYDLSLGVGDSLSLLELDGDDSGTVAVFEVVDWDTDIISTYIFPNPPDPPEGDLNLHNNNSYRPDADPVGTSWNELRPQYNQSLTLTSWFDVDGNSMLGVGDYIDLTDDITEAWNKYNVDWVGPTLTILLDQTTIYLEYIGFDKPDVGPIDDPRGTYWQEVYPNYPQTYVLLDWTDGGGGFLDNGDSAVFRNVVTGEDIAVSIDTVKTDIILTEISKTPPNPLPVGTAMHNTNFNPHYMPDQDPSGSQWEEFHPIQNWQVSGWFDNSDGSLSIGDYLDFYNPVLGWKKLKVEWVGPTIQVSLDQNTLYLDYVGFDKTDMSDITDVIGKYWQEISAAEGTYFYCVGWTDGADGTVGVLDYDDNLILQNMTTGQSAIYHIDDLATDIIVSEIELPDQIDGINLHNRNGWKTTDGDPINSNWHELLPIYCQDWELTGWIDNSDGKLSVGDKASFNSQAEPEYDVRWLGPTLKISLGEDTLYLDYLGVDNLEIDRISDPIGMFWGEVLPEYNQIYFCLDWIDEGDSYLGNGDSITLQEMTAGASEQYDVWYVQTGLIIGECDCVPGEIDGVPSINILDIVYLINYKYKSGPEPVLYEICSGDVQLDCVINILDIVYLINFKYKSGPVLPVCEDWTAECGPLGK